MFLSGTNCKQSRNCTAHHLPFLMFDAIIYNTVFQMNVTFQCGILSLKKKIAVKPRYNNI